MSFFRKKTATALDESLSVPYASTTSYGDPSMVMPTTVKPPVDLVDKRPNRWRRLRRPLSVISISPSTIHSLIDAHAGHAIEAPQKSSQASLGPNEIFPLTTTDSYRQADSAPAPAAAEPKTPKFRKGHRVVSSMSLSFSSSKRSSRTFDSPVSTPSPNGHRYSSSVCIDAPKLGIDWGDYHSSKLGLEPEAEPEVPARKFSRRPVGIIGRPAPQLGIPEEEDSTLSLDGIDKSIGCLISNSETETGLDIASLYLDEATSESFGGEPIATAYQQPTPPVARHHSSSGSDSTVAAPITSPHHYPNSGPTEGVSIYSAFTGLAPIEIKPTLEPALASPSLSDTSQFTDTTLLPDTPSVDQIGFKGLITPQTSFDRLTAKSKDSKTAGPYYCSKGVVFIGEDDSIDGVITPPDSPLMDEEMDIFDDDESDVVRLV